MITPIKTTTSLVIFAVLIGLVLYLTRSYMIPPSVEAHEAEANPEVKHEKKVVVKLETLSNTIRVYKPSGKALISLPKVSLDDPNKHVTASSLAYSREKRQIVTQVLDVTTGETEVFISDAVQPWFALENRGQITLDYGFKRDSNTPVGRINLHQDFLQIKSLHVGVSLSGYTDGDYFAGVGGTYRW